jgi:TRAP-type mannitol/chloroaromatic compound transport system permease small subunit
MTQILLNSLLQLNRLTRLIGESVRWLSLLMVIFSCLVVVLRYSFSIPSIALQEAVMYLHASLFMLGAAYTWQQGGHVRVDVFYRNWSAQRQAWVDRLGIVLLVLPVCLFMLWVSWDYVANAWAIGEKSPEAGGLPFVYLLKSLIVALPLLIILQALAELANTFVPHTDADESAEVEKHYG